VEFRGQELGHGQARGQGELEVHQGGVSFLGPNGLAETRR
jgi:hypothetical protein